MYAVVGCSDCRALWIVEGRPQTSQCPRCGTTRQFAKRRRFVTTEDEDHARDVRATLLAARQDREDAVVSFAELADEVERAGIDDETYLERSGLDAAAIADAADQGTGGSQNRLETVRTALRDLDDPTEDSVVEYAGERGVPAAQTREVLSKLARRGAVTRNDGVYRLL